MWIHTQRSADGFPDTAEFWTDGDQTQFENITQFVFNDNGIPGFTNPGSLQDTRIGDYLVVQQNEQNHFGMYVITGMATENDPDKGIIRTFEVKLYRGTRAYGDSEILSHCTVTTSRPVFTVVGDEQPIVSARGVLWYRETDDHLFISNYPDGFTGTGPQWTDLTAESGGEVHVGENPPGDPGEGDQWYDSTRLELFVYYVDGDGNGGWVPCSPWARAWRPVKSCSSNWWAVSMPWKPATQTTT